MNHSSRLFKTASPQYLGNNQYYGGLPQDISFPIQPQYYGNLPRAYGTVQRYPVSASVYQVPVSSYGPAPTNYGYQVYPQVFSPSSYYYQPVELSRRPECSETGLQRILIAILILVALDLIVVRPHKYPAQSP